MVSWANMEDGEREEGVVKEMALVAGKEEQVMELGVGMAAEGKEDAVRTREKVVVRKEVVTRVVVVRVTVVMVAVKEFVARETVVSGLPPPACSQMDSG